MYEIIDGKPIHYKGYREVLVGKKTFSDVMGSSGIQSLIVAYFQRILFKALDEEHYKIFSSESGLHLDRRNNLAGDILIFKNEILPIENIDEHYVEVPPKIVIEVDITADENDIENQPYLITKTQKLLDFGVEKVIWVLTKNKKITVATPDADWQIKDWDKDVEILDGIICNVGEYLRQKGSSFA
ncbi:MAG: Uma2 family endonuclease [Bacteroidetes bacterium]|nr:Uma2 family endonuclease [Bacteroidota bacterium]